VYDMYLSWKTEAFVIRSLLKLWDFSLYRMCNRVNPPDNDFSWSEQTNREKIREKQILVQYWMKQECGHNVYRTLQ
jgi:hypothetical protein